jgi:hypothetical protein
MKTGIWQVGLNTRNRRSDFLTPYLYRETLYPYPTRNSHGICLTHGILIIKIITTIITIAIVYNGQEGGDTTRRLPLIPAFTH